MRESRRRDRPRNERPSLARISGACARSRNVAGTSTCSTSVVDDARRASSGRADDERDTYRRLVQHALRHHPVVASHLAVIARVDDPRVGEHPAAVERGDDATDRVVDHADVGAVRAAHAANRVVGHRRRVGEVEKRLEQPAVSSGAVDVGPARGRRHRDLDVGVAVDRGLRRVPRIVRTRKADEQEERLVARRSPRPTAAPARRATHRCRHRAGSGIGVESHIGTRLVAPCPVSFSPW